MAAARKVIITCAMTGAIHTPSMSLHLPVTPDEIVADALGAAEAGAAILHLHARDPETGKPDQTPEAFARFLPRIKQRSNAVINLTTGGSPFMSPAERVKPAAHFKPEVASLNMGSMNFGLFPMLERYKEFKHDWERAHLENSRDLVFRNSFKDIEYILRTCADNGTRFEFECYDIGHLYNLKHFLDRGLVKPPLFVQSVFGILGGIGTHAEDVAHMKRTADRLFGEDYRWSVLGAGAAQMRIAAQAAAMGGNVRVGLEDSLWAGPKRLAKSSGEQVRIVRAILEGLGLEIATPDEARAILSLKGADRVAF
ncbi:MAG: 3-keto-5-aminohexanoate cleavage protein [Alphaproteobacteria bacterium]|nr:3-keto-5-aminohexanoate cleavage protein [Alphaproteobacteria bacterium]